MLAIEKIQNNNTNYQIHNLNNSKISSFGNNPEARQAYLAMNKDVYCDFVDGDVSFAKFMLGKFQNLWRVITHHNPALEVKARMIEESFKADAYHKLNKIA